MADRVDAASEGVTTEVISRAREASEQQAPNDYKGVKTCFGAFITNGYVCP